MTTPWPDPVDGAPARHARVWLDPAAWRAASTAPLEAADVAALDAWIARGRATVARRREPAAGPACGLGVALPSAEGRRRIAFAVDRRAVVRVAPPLTLAEAIPHAPPAWRQALDDLVRGMHRAGSTFHVYGSLAWQAICGEPCVGPGSDVDLLWLAADAGQVERVLALLVDWERASGLRADGELLLANGDAVAWRELLGTADRVLVKHRDRVSLQPAGFWRAPDLADASR